MRQHRRADEKLFIDDASRPYFPDAAQHCRRRPSAVRRERCGFAGCQGRDMSLPQTTNSAQLMQTCSAQGWEQLDHSALVKAIELIAAHPAAGL